jgi:uncharacterized SAM-binding protein YcdF (DUF218 family)
MEKYWSIWQKMEKYEVAIVLGHELKKDNGRLKLSEQTKERVDLGIDLLNNKIVSKLIMSGGHSDIGQCYGKSLAEIMKKYAISQGVNEDIIMTEDSSLETVGQLLFCKISLIEPLKIKKIVFITHKYNHKRVKEEAEFIFPKATLKYALVQSGFSQKIEEKEKESLQNFWKTFMGIHKGDNNALLNRLFEAHKIYKDHKNLKTKLDNYNQRDTK